MSHILDIVGALVGLALIVGLVLSVRLVMKDRPPQSAPSQRQARQSTGRSLRVWQNRVNADIRRRGRGRRF